MTDTALDHPLVRGYLYDLDHALASLPAAQARELTEQVTAHLDDALGPGSTDQEIAAALRQLGSPADLAAEASAGAGAPDAAAALGAAPRGGGVQLRLRWPRLGWRRWAMIGAALALVGTAAGYWIAMATAPALESGGSFGWWYPRDAARAVYAQADGAQQVTVPIRSGQQQGYVVTVYNPSGWTQTVLGVGPGDWSAPGSENAEVGVATSDPNVFPPPDYALPVSIPPQQFRAVRVLWVSDVCLDPGSSVGIDRLTLRVRVGWLTRTEVIPLDLGVYLSGPSQGRCV